MSTIELLACVLNSHVALAQAAELQGPGVDVPDLVGNLFQTREEREGQ
jgi:hypothetical protein